MANKMKKSEDFTTALMKELSKNAYNYYVYNRDYDRFGRPSTTKSVKLFLEMILVFILKSLRLTVSKKRYRTDLKRIEEIEVYFGGLNNLYAQLNDENSKRTLVELVAYRILGRHRVKLSLNNKSFWRKKKEVCNLLSGTQTIPFINWKLHHFDLNAIGYNIELFNTQLGVLGIFILEQYKYDKCSKALQAEKDDFVIDAGGCWGDSALYFANAVGEEGKVFSFEFIPSNLEIMARNIALNPHLKDRIEIVKKPLWDLSGKALFCTNHGPGSRINENKPEGDFVTVSTVSIDDFARENKLKKIDFIKMDIEGAELSALRGARNTIERFKPKLAISVYHNFAHFAEIPEFLNSLNFKYDFYLDHYTTHLEETVLYAIPRP
jgi:FkbM family methyltransferase